MHSWQSKENQIIQQYYYCICWKKKSINMVHGKKIWYCPTVILFGPFLFVKTDIRKLALLFIPLTIFPRRLCTCHTWQSWHTHPSNIAHTLKLPMLTHVGVTHTYTNPKYVCVGVCECVMVISFPLHIHLSVKSDHLQQS